MRYARKTGGFQFVFALVAALTLLSLLGGPALADDLSPPWWPRQGITNLSTSQQWEFFTNNAVLAPDGNTVPLHAGNGGAGPTAATSPNLVWSIGDGDGQWTNTSGIQGAISLPIPNWIDNEPIKFMHLQATYTGAAPFFTIESLSKTGFVGNFVTIQTGIHDFAANAPQFQHVEDWQIIPNPDWENLWLRIPPGTAVDQLIIDTISGPVPEPATLLACGLGGLLILGRRRGD